jgi:hypothetical protein
VNSFVGLAMVDHRVAVEKQNGVGTSYIPPMTRRLKCRIDPGAAVAGVNVSCGSKAEGLSLSTSTSAYRLIMAV